MIEYIIILLAVILTGTPLGTVYYSTLTIVFFFSVIVSFLALKPRRLKKSAFIYVAALMLICIISMLINLDNDMNETSENRKLRNDFLKDILKLEQMYL